MEWQKYEAQASRSVVDNWDLRQYELSGSDVIPGTFDAASGLSYLVLAWIWTLAGALVICSLNFDKGVDKASMRWVLLFRPLHKILWSEMLFYAY